MIYPRVNLVQVRCLQPLARRTSLRLASDVCLSAMSPTQVLCGEGREMAALEHAKTCVVAEEGNADRHYMLGCIHRTLGNDLEAAQSFARAVKLRPTFLEAYINNDAVLLKLGSLKGCHKYAEIAVRETRTHGVPFWTNPLQRPPAFVPVRTSSPSPPLVMCAVIAVVVAIVPSHAVFSSHVGRVCC